MKTLSPMAAVSRIQADAMDDRNGLLACYRVNRWKDE